MDVGGRHLFILEAWFKEYLKFYKKNDWEDINIDLKQAFTEMSKSEQENVNK